MMVCLMRGRRLLGRRRERGKRVSRRSSPRCGEKDFGAAVEFGTEEGLGLIEVASHAHGLGTLAGEHEDEGGVGLLGGAFDGARFVEGEKRVADEDLALGEVLAADAQGVGDVGGVGLATACAVVEEVFFRLCESFVAAGGEGEELEGAGREGGFLDGRLLQDDVGIGAADAEGRDARATGDVLGLPVGESVVDVEGGAREVDFWIRFLEVEGGAGFFRARGRRPF